MNSLSPIISHQQEEQLVSFLFEVISILMKVFLRMYLQPLFLQTTSVVIHMWIGLIKLKGLLRARAGVGEG